MQHGHVEQGKTEAPFVRIVAFSIAWAVLYGIVQDEITAHVCVEYFTVGHVALPGLVGGGILLGITSDLGLSALEAFLGLDAAMIVVAWRLVLRRRRAGPGPAQS